MPNDDELYQQLIERFDVYDLVEGLGLDAVQLLDVLFEQRKDDLFELLKN